MVTKMMWYDYLYSVTGKPVYNSEDHFIKDGTTKYDDDQRTTIRYNLWQGAVHGRAMSTMWVWDRSYDENSALYNSILTRPDCVAEAGYTSLDMMRSADDIIKLSSKTPEVALFYSKTSRIFNDDHMGNLVLYYKALLCSGKRVGFVTETSLDKLSNYDCLIIPSVTHTTPEAVTAVKNYLTNGGKVIYYDANCMKYDKFGKTLDNGTIISRGTKFTVKDTNPVRLKLIEYFSNDRIRVKDNATGEAAKDIEYEYDISGGKILINMVKFGAGTQNVSVYMDGQKLTGMKNILTGEVTGDSHNLTGYTPLTLKMRYSTQTPSKPKNLSYRKDVLSWDDDEKAVKYNVYYKPQNGSESLYTVTEDNFCSGMGDGVYRVEGVNTLGTVGESARITVASELKVSFDEVNVNSNRVCATVTVRNTSEKFQKGVVIVMTKEGKVAVDDTWISPMGSISFEVSFNGTTEQITASVGASYDNQYMSVTYDVSE